MKRVRTDSELASDLLARRGVQWIMGTQDDPYALFLRVASDDPDELGRQIRDRGAVYWSHAEAWVTASHELGRAALDDPRLSPRHVAAGDSRADEDEPAEEADPMPWEFPALRDILPLDDAFVHMDRARCDRLYRLTEPVIGTGAVARFGPDAARACQASLRSLGGEFDLMGDFARASATALLGTLLGLPPDQHERFAELCAGAASVLDATMCPPLLATARELMASVSGLRELLTESIEGRPDRPEGDLIGGLLGALADEKSVADDVLAVCVLLAVVGVEVTANLTCNAVSALLDHPEQWKRLLETPDLALGAVEETLRYAPPVRLQALVAHEDVRLAGQTVERGSELVVVIAAANRDPAAYPDPDRFDILREPHPGHLSLHGGLHTSLIAPLARLQAAAAVRAIATELPEIRQADVILRRLRSPVTAGVLRFPVSAA